MNYGRDLYNVQLYDNNKTHSSMTTAHIVTFVYNNKGTPILTHCGLMKSYGNTDLGQHWLK